MNIVTTNPGRKLEMNPIERIGSKDVHAPLVELSGERDQEILGFGAALTDSACVLLNRLDPLVRDDLLEEIFSPQAGNFSISRICVGASDYADKEYHFAPVADDLEMKHFDASHDDETIIPILQKVKTINPDLFLFSSPWSPPGWMKSSHQMQGGWMLDKYIDAYALYYYKFIKYYMERGISLNALTAQNESETDQQSKMPACYWHPEQEMRFAQKIRSLLDADNLENIKIWLMDHNFIMWHRAAFQMDDEMTRKACAGIAWHPYEGYPEQISIFRKQHPESENHWTEGGIIPEIVKRPEPRYGNRNQPMYAAYGQSFIAGLENGCQSITVWNLALDEEGYPNIGPFDCRGTLEISRDGRTVTRSEEYDTLLHLTKYVRRGAKRIISDQTALPAAMHLSAFENTDGQVAILLSNRENFDSKICLKIGDDYYQIPVQRESINTILI